ncbi:acyltransferase family protein [Microbacterium karelineae]|uniref:acyltransferase family protein n=1 Tax=Microbacterium karelineae TaxID=2654283 RepID=UPI0012EA060C|nr:acyltransferase family protein [Microbacterium karelineae]
MVTIDARVAPPLRRRRTSVRIGEIDGLRGIALTLVVVFHLFGNGRVSGGVDVFLTVSGFLLILSLGRAVGAGRPLGILQRWARTFARLAPPAALVLVAVTFLAFMVYSPWLRAQNLVEVVSAALYVENWQLITSQLSYGAAGPATSPLQHFWSLSVQAQFFLVFPLLPALIVVTVHSRGMRERAFWALLMIATMASFAYAWRENGADPQSAYFDSFARFWELGIGGLVAGLVLARRVVAAVLRPLAGWVGLAMVVVSGFVFDGGSMYPGPAALLPVGGAVLVILSASGGPASPTALLTSRPLRRLDGISYGLYLWHWPLLILVLTVTDSDAISWFGAVIVLAASVGATMLTRVLLRAPTVWATRGRAIRSLAIALIAIVVAAAPAAGAHAAILANSSAHTVGTCAGAPSLDSDRPECAAEGAGASPIPSLDLLSEDTPDRPDCYARWGDAEAKVCALGPTSGFDKRLLVVGDSHNHALSDAYAEIADSLGWRFDLASRAGCQWVSSAAPDRSGPESVQVECADWRSEIDEIAASGDYDAILTTASSNSWFRPAPEGMSVKEFHTELILEAWRHRASDDVPILAIRDNPIFPSEMLDCLLDGDAVERGECSIPRDEAIRESGFPEAVALMPNAHLIDLMDVECAPVRCDMVVGGVIVTRDGQHLTRTFAQTLRPYLEREISRLVE